MTDNFTFYDGNMKFHSFPMWIAGMVQHLYIDHDMSVRVINRRMNLTDLEVREVLGQNDGQD